MSELKNNSNNSIVTQDNNVVNLAVDSGERISHYTTDGVDDSWEGQSVDNLDPTQVKPTGAEIIKKLGLKKKSRTTKAGTKEFYIVDSQGNECLVNDSRKITSLEDFRTEVQEINEHYDIELSEADVAKLINKDITKLSNKPPKKSRKRSSRREQRAERFKARAEEASELKWNIKHEIASLKCNPTTPKEGEVHVGTCHTTGLRIYAPIEETISSTGIDGEIEYSLKDDVVIETVMGDKIAKDKPYYCSFKYSEDLVLHFIEQQKEGKLEGVEYGRWCYENNLRPWRLDPKPRPIEEIERSYKTDRFKYSDNGTRHYQFLNPEPNPFDKQDWDDRGCGDKNRLTLILMKGGFSLKNEEALTHIKPIKQNIFTGNIEFYGEPMEVSIAEVEHFQNKFNVKNREFKAVVTNEALKNKYNPVEEFFTNLYLGYLGEESFLSLGEAERDTSKLLKIHDSVVATYQHSTKKISGIHFEDIFPEVPKTISSLEEYIATGFHLTDKWYIDAVRKSMISAVARTFDPGCKVDETLILKGEQGVRKSTATEVIGFRDLGFQTKKMDNEVKGKEAVMSFQGGFIHEIDEIDRITCTRLASETKSFFTSSVDTFVPKYANNSINVPRHWIVIGTTNEQDLFLDHENRRYNVVEITKEVDIDYLREHREMAWALAIDAYFKGENWWYELDSEGAMVRRERNRNYMFSDSRTSEVLPQLEKFELVDANIVARVLEGFDPTNFQIPNKKSINEARDILKKSGWLKASGKRKLADGRRTTAAYINPDYKSPKQRQEEKLKN